MRKTIANNRSGRVQGFTLIELLVACALTMILGLLLVSIFGQVAGNYQQIGERAESFREARAAMQFMSAELNRLIDARRFSDTNAAGYTPPPRLETGIDGSTNDSLGFLTRLSLAAQPTNESSSDVCLVSYFLSKPDSGEGQALYRRLIPSKTAFDRLGAGQSSFFASTDFNRTNAELLAANVIDFHVSLKDTNLNPTTVADDAAYVEFFLKVIGSRAAKLYFASNTPPATLERLKETDSRSFTLRCRVP